MSREPEVYLWDGERCYPLTHEQGRTNAERARNVGPHLAACAVRLGPHPEWPHVNPPEILAVIREELQRRYVRAGELARARRRIIGPLVSIGGA